MSDSAEISNCREGVTEVTDMVGTGQGQERRTKTDNGNHDRLVTRACFSTSQQPGPDNRKSSTESAKQGQETAEGVSPYHDRQPHDAKRSERTNPRIWLTDS